MVTRLQVRELALAVQVVALTEEPSLLAPLVLACTLQAVLSELTLIEPLMPLEWLEAELREGS